MSGGWSHRKDAGPSGFSPKQLLYSLWDEGDSIRFLTYRFESETKHHVRVTPLHRGVEPMGERTLLKGDAPAKDLYASREEAVLARAAVLENRIVRARVTIEQASLDLARLRVALATGLE